MKKTFGKQNFFIRTAAQDRDRTSGKQMNTAQKKLLKRFLSFYAAAMFLPMLLYGVYEGWFHYTFYRDYKTLRTIKLSHLYDNKYERFEIDLPVQFVPERHDSNVVQKRIVRAENRKVFLILRYDDNRVQLEPFPAKRYLWSNRYYKACYEVSSPEAAAKLQEVLESSPE